MIKRILLAMAAILLPAQSSLAAVDVIARGIAIQNSSTASLHAMTIEERCNREGVPFSVSNHNYPSGTSVASGGVNTGLTSTSPTFQVGYISYYDNVWASVYPPSGSTGFSYGQILLSADSGNVFTAPNQFFPIPPGGVITPAFHVGEVVRPVESTGGFSLAVRNNATGGTATFLGTISVTGCKLTDDLNWSAPRIELQVGDSTCSGTGPTKSSTMWPFIEKEYIRSTVGKDIRLILRCLSGINSTQAESYRAAGWFDVGPDVKLINWVLGLNDATQGVSSGTFVANATAFWNWAHGVWPNAQIWFFGPGPMNNGFESNAVGLRSALQTWVGTVSDSHIHYCNLGASFTPTTSGDYSDGTLHPNDTGHALEWTQVQSCVGSTLNNIQ